MPEPEHPGTPVSFEELKKLDAYFDEQLKTPAPATRPFSLKKLLMRLAAALFFLVLPFMLLIRGSTLLYLEYQLNGWLALAGGVAVTIVLLMVYALTAGYYIKRSFRIGKFAARALVALVVVYCGYSLFYFSSMNVKTQEIRSYYRSLHPLLRVTLTTATLADSKLIITDTKRTPSDYAAMGLNPREESLHFIQDNGYVHAVDLRTIGRPEWLNLAMQYGLELLGFQTLRHSGTADHLHVSLPLPG